LAGISCGLRGVAVFDWYLLWIERTVASMLGLECMTASGIDCFPFCQVGRSVDETLRLVQAFQYTDHKGEGTYRMGWWAWQKRHDITASQKRERLGVWQRRHVTEIGWVVGVAEEVGTTG
jgi:hypothetical protein